MRLLQLLGVVTPVLFLVSITGERETPTYPGEPVYFTPERLAGFEGEWIRNGLPAGTVEGQTCTWQAGGRLHMICRQRLQSANMNAEQMAVLSYRNSDSTYLLSVFAATGQLWRYEGRPEGNRWVLNRIPNRPDRPINLRQVIVVAPDTLHFMEEAPDPSGAWRLSDPSEDFRYVRVKR